MMQDKYIRFDWAMKRMLRDKANFVVLEGLLTVLLERKITILIGVYNTAATLMWRCYRRTRLTLA